MVLILDDNWDTERMVIRAGSAAFGLYVRCGMWVARNLTDGVIPPEIAAAYGTPEWIRRLLDVGLWETHADGYLDPHHLKRNPTAERAAVRREQKADRQRRWLENQGTKKRRTTDTPRDASQDASKDRVRDGLHLLSSSSKKEMGARHASRGAAHTHPDDNPPWPAEDPTVLADEEERLREVAETRVQELDAARKRRASGAALARRAALGKAPPADPA